MSESPLAASPYDVLGVSADVTDSDLRRAYRRLLRKTHPDTGGDVTRYLAVQRAWEIVGTSDARAAYDARHRMPHPPSSPQSSSAADHGGSGATSWSATWSETSSRLRRDSRPSARSHGHPGGWTRERFLDLIREWAGRGVELGDPYDPEFVRGAPWVIRHMLADALAEEATARSLSELGIGFTLWHDLATDAAGAAAVPKLDHLVLGATGLWAIQSEDWGAPVAVKRGELVGEALGDDKPLHDLSARAKAVGRAARVKVTALLVVVPDGAAPDSLQVIGSRRGAVTAVVEQSRLLNVLRTGLPGSIPIGGTELMEVRSRLAASVRFA